MTTIVVNSDDVVIVSNAIGGDGSGLFLIVFCFSMFLIVSLLLMGHDKLRRYVRNKYQSNHNQGIYNPFEKDIEVKKTKWWKTWLIKITNINQNAVMYFSFFAGIFGGFYIALWFTVDVLGVGL